MIEVVVRRTEHLTHYRQVCGNCRSELRFTAKDLSFDPDPAGRGEGSASLDCPVCKRRTTFGYTNNETQFAKENTSLLETQEQYVAFQRGRVLNG